MQPAESTECNAVSLSEVVSALSFALDLTEDAVPGHAIRSCLLAMQIANAIAMPAADQASLYYASLMKDAGCSSNAARLCQIVEGDERRVKRAVKLEDWTRASWSGARMLWRNAAPGHGLAKKLSTVFRAGIHQQQNNQEMIGLRCERGAQIAKKIGLTEQSAEAVRHLDEHWDGSGFPDRLKGEHIPLCARILAVAQHLDAFCSESGAQAALNSLVERGGRWFDPALVRAAADLHREGLLWKHTGVEHEVILGHEPGGMSVASEERIDRLCEAFAEVVDAKSSFTYRHSIGVTEAAMRIAGELGFDAGRSRNLYRAALLHDIGKLRVPNSILDKNGKLAPAEWAIVREHPALTRRILERVHPFSGIAAVAGQHHERLDGSGYPEGLRADDLSLDARVVAVADIYAALAEDRPYRPGLPLDHIRGILAAEVLAKLDRQCVDALMSSLEGHGDEA